MKALFHICFILFFFIFPSCNEKIDIPSVTYYSDIPLNDRFIYKIGDKLVYKCSDGTSVAVTVTNYLFWTNVTTGYEYIDPHLRFVVKKMQQQRITIASSSDIWNNAINTICSSNSFTSRCYIISTDVDNWEEGEDPNSWIMNSCNIEIPGPMFKNEAERTQFISFNNKSYQKVYSASRNVGNNNLKLYWNLKYGIIRFESVVEGKQEIWDLESPKM